MVQDQYLAAAYGEDIVVGAVSNVNSRNADGVVEEGQLLVLGSVPTAEKLLFSSPEVRRIVVEMFSVFDRCRQLRKISTLPDGKLSVEESLSISREYRSVLRSAAYTESATSESHMRDFTLWSLFETMFLKRGDNPILLDLIEWASECFTFVETAAKQALVGIENRVPLLEGHFWEAVAKTMVGCNFELCCEFLREVDKQPEAKILIGFLERIDTAWINDEAQTSKIYAWRRELEACVQAKTFDSNGNIAFLAKVLLGEGVYLERVANKLLSEWWQLMPFYVFIRCPDAQYTSLGELAEECRGLFKSVVGNLEDDPFLALFHVGDITVLHNSMSCPWLSVHLADLMCSSDSKIWKNLEDVRNSMLLNYGDVIMTNTSLWEVGADYLGDCGIDGMHRLYSRIEALPLGDEITAEKVVQFCDNHEQGRYLEEAKQCVVNTISYRHLRLGEWSAAIDWSIRSSKSKTLDVVVNKILWSAKHSDIAELTILEHLGDQILLLPSLSFLYQYYRYHKTLTNGDLKCALQTLVPLVKSMDVPSTFHRILFRQFANILNEAKELLIPRERIYDLVAFFNRYSLDMPKDASEEDQKTVLVVKKLLAHRLGRAIVAQ